MFRGLGFRVYCLGSRVQGLGFGVYLLGGILGKSFVNCFRMGTCHMSLTASSLDRQMCFWPWGSEGLELFEGL